MSQSPTIDSEGFQLPWQQRKKKKRTVITGKSSNTQLFKAGPAPSRELFIYRVDHCCTEDALQSYIEDHRIEIRKIECVSNPNAKYKSFKLSVAASEFPKLFNDEIWPDGVKIRKFISPRS